MLPSASRRRFLSASTAALLGAPALARASTRAAAATIRVGSCTIGLEQAKAAGLDGVEVGVGGPADRLQIADPDYRKKLQDQMQATGLPIRSLMMGLLNDCPLATDPRAPEWLEQAIDAASELGAPIILVAFFGNGDLLGEGGQIKGPEIQEAMKRLKAAAPRARDLGVVLAIENYLPGRLNARILNAIDSEAVKVYYDVYNTGVTRGHDVPADIRLLGHHIAQFHFKNGPDYLDKGNIDFPAIAKAIHDINYDGWIVLETSNPSKDPVADAKRNGEFVRKLFAS